MVPVAFSPKSRQDLADIGDCLAKDSRANARRFVSKLVEQCKRIGNAPLGYTSREDLAVGLHMAAIGRYVIFFRVIDGTCASNGYCMAPGIFPWCLEATTQRPPSRQRRLLPSRLIRPPCSAMIRRQDPADDWRMQMLTIEHLLRTEKLRMMEALWDDLSREDSPLPSPAWHDDALREAEAALAAGETDFIDWDQAKKLLLGGDAA